MFGRVGSHCARHSFLGSFCFPKLPSIDPKKTWHNCRYIKHNSQQWSLLNPTQRTKNRPDILARMLRCIRVAASSFLLYHSSSCGPTTQPIGAPNSPGWDQNSSMLCDLMCPTNCWIFNFRCLFKKKYTEDHHQNPFVPCKTQELPPVGFYDNDLLIIGQISCEACQTLITTRAQDLHAVAVIAEPRPGKALHSDEVLQQPGGGGRRRQRWQMSVEMALAVQTSTPTFPEPVRPLDEQDMRVKCQLKSCCTCWHFMRIDWVQNPMTLTYSAILWISQKKQDCPTQCPKCAQFPNKFASFIKAKASKSLFFCVAA